MTAWDWLLAAAVACFAVIAGYMGLVAWWCTWDLNRRKSDDK